MAEYWPPSKEHLVGTVLEPGHYTLKPGAWLINLAYSASNHWSFHDAIGELLRNQKDAIMKTFALEPREYLAVVEVDNENQIVLAIRHPTFEEDYSINANKQLLGYISFDKEKRTIEIANLEAKLSLRNMQLGGITKTSDQQSLGFHGMGLKLAVQHLLKGDCDVQYAANIYTWTFELLGSMTNPGLVCHLKPDSKKTLKEKKDKFAEQRGESRGFTSNIWEDVSVLVNLNKRNFTEDDFLELLHVSFDTKDIGRPAEQDIIRSSFGDVVLDKKFENMVFLRGIRLNTANNGRRRLKYGYNIIMDSRHNSHDRFDAFNNAGFFCNVYMGGYESTKLKIKLLDTYIALLKVHPKYAETHRAKEMLGVAAIIRIWNRLKETSNDGFYVSEGIGLEELDFAQNVLKRDPILLSDFFWGLLRRPYPMLARTPREYGTMLFDQSPAARLPEDSFSMGIERGLKAAMTLSTYTNRINILYVVGGDGDDDAIQLKFDPSQLQVKVHSRWLSFDDMHRQSPWICSTYGDSTFCYHVIEELYRLLLSTIYKHHGLRESRPAETEKNLFKTLKSKVNEMPSLIKVEPTGVSGELQVSWITNDSSSHPLHAHKPWVVLHRERTCFDKREHLLAKVEFEPHSEGEVYAGTHQRRAICGCFVIADICSHTKLTFKGLNNDELYFPMVASDGQEGFYGVPPPSVKPQTSHIGPSSSTPTSSLRLNPINNNFNDATPSAARIPDQLKPDLNSKPVLQLNEDAEWNSWEELILPSAFGNFVSDRLPKIEVHPAYVRARYDDRLDFTFKRGEYYQIKSRLHQRGKTVNYIILVHGVIKPEVQDQTNKLLVTRYSFLASSSILDSSDKPFLDPTIYGKELILHFSEFEEMGTESDAEIMSTDQFVHDDSNPGVVHLPEFPLVYSAQLQKDTDDHFCRFAIHAGVDDKTAWLTPIGPHLLQPKDRRNNPEYQYPCSPLLWDVNSEVLGASEGFSQLNYMVQAGFNFDKNNNMTWKARYSEATVYDTSLAATITDISKEHIIGPDNLGPETPRILLISGANNRFHLTGDLKDQESSLDQFLKPIKDLRPRIINGLDPDDLVILAMSPAILHERAITVFQKAILDLLESRRSVHMRKIYLPELGIPQERTIITLVGSHPVHFSPWALIPPLPNPITVGDLIEDLSFESRRSKIDGHSSYVCAMPNLEGNIYNHQTGYMIDDSTTVEVVDFASTAMRLGPQLGPNYAFLKHPTRNDFLTVREIARLQGFPDNFIFYDDDKRQLQQVIEALPPPVAKMIAASVMNIIKNFRKDDDLEEVEFRGRKRARVDT